MLTVACVWVQGNVPYGVEYVARLRAMVAKHLSRPFRFVCLTDRPSLVPEGVEPITVPNLRPLAGWWSKVELFNPENGLTGRVLYLDLDTLIVGALDPIADYSSQFALVPDAGSFKPRTRHQVVKRFNSSVMVWEAGVTAQIHEEWAPDLAERYWGDQDWIGVSYPQADTMPLAWFPRLSAIQAGPVPTEAVVVLAKKPKPEQAAAKWPWVDAAWRAA